MGSLRSRHDVPIEETIKSLHTQIDNAAFLGLKSVITFGTDNAGPGGPLPDVDGRRRGLRRGEAVQGRDEAARREQRRVRGDRRGMKKVNHPNFRIWYDAGNIIYYTGKDPIEELKPIVQYVTGFCAKDCAAPKRDVMIQFGTGKVDFTGVFSVLKRAGLRRADHGRVLRGRRHGRGDRRQRAREPRVPREGAGGGLIGFHDLSERT